MSIEIKHTDKSGLQWFNPSYAIHSLIEADSYLIFIEKRFGLVPFTLKVDGIVSRERKNHNKPSIIYVQ